jgi:FkbM family methyltransferase
MNSLRRIATLPGLRAVLLRPGVRRRVASVLALRFQVAALSTTTPGRVVAGEVFSRGRVRTYRVRHTGVPVALQHGRDMEALFELFVRGEYEPPSPLRDRLSPDTVRTILDVGANVGMFSAWARGCWPRARIVALEPAPENLVVLHEQARLDGRTEVVEAAVGPADGEVGFVEGWGGGGHVPTEQEVATTVVRTVDWFPLFAEADFVKMDIEGGEWPILGDPRLRDLERLTLVMEYHRVGAPSLPAGAAARGLLEAAGFEVGHDTPNYWGHGTLWAWKG